jgi:hypothetical protein
MSANDPCGAARRPADVPAPLAARRPSFDGTTTCGGYLSQEDTHIPVFPAVCAPTPARSSYAPALSRPCDRDGHLAGPGLEARLHHLRADSAVRENSSALRRFPDLRIRLALYASVPPLRAAPGKPAHARRFPALRYGLLRRLVRLCERASIEPLDAGPRPLPRRSGETVAHAYHAVARGPRTNSALLLLPGAFARRPESGRYPHPGIFLWKARAPPRGPGTLERHAGSGAWTNPGRLSCEGAPPSYRLPPSIEGKTGWCRCAVVYSGSRVLS